MVAVPGYSIGNAPLRIERESRPVPLSYLGVAKLAKRRECLVILIPVGQFFGSDDVVQ